MNTLLRHLPTEYTQKTGHCQFVGFDIGMATEPNYTLDGSLTAENTHVNRFHFYRAADDFATELHPIPTMVKGGYYGLRESARQAVEPEDPIELVQCVVKSSVLLPITDRVLGKNTVVYEAMTVKNTARLAAFLKSISLHKWYVPETLVSPAKNPVDKWTARLKDFSSLELGWDSYRADPPSKVALLAAGEFLAVIHEKGLEPSKLNPAVVGGVGFTFRNTTRSVYIEFRNTGNVHAAFIGANPEPDVVKVPIDRKGYVTILTEAEKYLHEQTASGHADEQPTP